MSDKPIPVKAENILVVTVRSRKTKGKNPEGAYETLYAPLTKNIVEQFDLKEGETLTLGIIKRSYKIPEVKEEPEQIII